jgi:hypothetical protein
VEHQESFVVDKIVYLYKNKNICLDDFYYKNKKFFYKDVRLNYYKSTLETGNDIVSGYVYNPDNKKCYYNGFTQSDYTFLIGLSSVLISFVLYLLLAQLIKR